MYNYRPSKNSRWEFSAEHLGCAHVLAAAPSTRTLAEIEVFFASAKLRQKRILKTRFAGEIQVFDRL